MFAGPGMHLWPVLHASPHSGDAWGILAMIAVWVGMFAATSGAIVGVLAWRERGRTRNSRREE